MEQWIQNLFTDEVKKQAIGFFLAEDTPLEDIGGFENFVLQYIRDEKPYILRLTHNSHRSYNQVRGELEFIDHLAKGGANVITPVYSKSGVLVETVDAEDGSKFFVISYLKADGDWISYESRTPEIFRLWGKTIGQMHRLALDFVPSRPEFKRIQWHEDDLYIPENYITDLTIVEKYKKLLKHIRVLPEDHRSFGLIHSDVHCGNIVRVGEKIKVFDFDDAMHMHLISDLAIVFYYETQRWHILGEDREQLNLRAKEMLPPFLEGYREEYQLEQKWMSEMDTFIKLRDLTLYSVFIKKRDGLGEKSTKKMLEIENRLKNDIDLLSIDFSKYKL